MDVFLSEYFEIIVISATAILSAVTGYVFSYFRSGKVILELNHVIDQKERQLADHHQKIVDLETSFQSLKQTQLALQLDRVKVEESYRHSQLAEARLSEEKNALSEELQSVTEALSQQVTHSHQRDKAYEISQADLAAEKNSKEALNIRLEMTLQQLEEERSAMVDLKDLMAEKTQRNKVLKNTMEQKELHFAEQLQQLESNKQAMTKEFENLANKIFEEKGKSFTATNQDALASMLKPFREQIKGFQERVNQVNDETIKGNTKLESEIQKVLNIGLKMSDEANNLTSALKGDSQKRGAWGEAQLRKTLEMSGLVEDQHFSIQTSFKNQDGQTRITDFLINLPDNQTIIIDSKVSLVAYDSAVSAETEEQYNLAMNHHIKAVKAHIDDLASKDYTNLIGMQSPSFVLMFMPIEPAYIEALKHNKDLFEYGYKKGIVLVSHTTLIPILRTVSNLWMIQQSNEQAREVSEKAGDIYNSVRLIAERLEKLGATLTTASKHYNDTVKAVSGQQGIYGKVQRFGQLSTKVSKSLPELDSKHTEFEKDRLRLIVEEIPDSLEEESNEDKPDKEKLDVLQEKRIEKALSKT